MTASGLIPTGTTASRDRPPVETMRLEPIARTGWGAVATGMPRRRPDGRTGSVRERDPLESCSSDDAVPSHLADARVARDGTPTRVGGTPCVACS
jgi:hypothetical protein